MQGQDQDQPATQPLADPADTAHDNAQDHDNGAPAQAQPQPDNQQGDELVDVFSPAGGYPKAPSLNVQPGGQDEPVVTTDDSPTLSQTEDLVSIKQHALDELIPLVDQLDQTPEERFKTLMMMIQASDNQSLVEAAYQAAHNIEDEKTKAQALLDIVNEINYFTQHAEN